MVETVAGAAIGAKLGEDDGTIGLPGALFGTVGETGLVPVILTPLA